MYKFMFCSFVFLGWAFWEMSGGSEFEAPMAQAADAGDLETYDVVQASVVTRSRLTATDVVAEPLQPQPAALVIEQPVEEAVVADDQVADLANGIDTLNETYAPTTTSAISVQPATNVPEPVINNADIRAVDGNRVNMRNGPSTDFAVLDQLVRGDRVEVLAANDDGWVRLRVESTGQVGWMAERLLTNVSN